MARYTGPITKKSRRYKLDLVGGDKNFDLRPFPPGQHGRRRIQEKEYLTQLQEKQRARFTYGVMEKQFSRYYQEAKAAQGKTGDALLQILETRLDNVVYRLGFAKTRRDARAPSPMPVPVKDSAPGSLEKGLKMSAAVVGSIPMPLSSMMRSFPCMEIEIFASERDHVYFQAL